MYEECSRFCQHVSALWMPNVKLAAKKRAVIRVNGYVLAADFVIVRKRKPGKKMFIFRQVILNVQRMKQGAVWHALYQQASPSDIQKALVRGAPLKPLNRRGEEKQMLYAVIGFIIGNLSGAVLICLLQIDVKEGYGGKNDAGGSKKTQSEQEDEDMEALLSELKEKGREEII